ncbi:dehydrogenase [Heyndrickxia shackletonii]|uniref:Dehydrogenase n=1 Tax=Heyndrickxia shackletonii TaxID=157838 RepID=A0A0Q3WSX3_9BACI|nr:Gfo/Idh/MocA family oxidoreductase [Heyndrickxia shackletonii]KQL50740.1 dehydrogenase [Heyndrickxia shackletonii]NEY99694.1 Gfo/Idh/MocA family oxidoreductase [Heyndrickxia shackletonii]
MSKLRLGVIGVGGIAVGRHIPAFRKLKEEVTIVAVSDVNIERAKSVAEEFDIPHSYEDYRDMLSEVDAVVVCTPNKFHSEITVHAIEAGVHVLCEKPMAMTAEECQAMVEAAKAANKVLSIGFHYRYMKESQAAKKIMATKEIGDPLVVRVQALRRRKVPGWGVFTNKDLQGGGSLIDYGCHLLDLSLWLMGNPKPIEVTGTTYNTLSKQPGQVNQWGSFDHETFNVDDHVTGYIRFDNGASMLLEVSWAANIESDKESVTISGDQGGLEVFPFKLNYAKHGMLFNSEATWIPSEEDPGYSQAKNFVDACVNGAELVVKPEEALFVSQIIEAIYKSSQEKKSVQL